MSTATFAEFAERADYSLLVALTPDPEATADGEDHRPRQVLSGHYVPVTPTPLPQPQGRIGPVATPRSPENMRRN